MEHRAYKESVPHLTTALTGPLRALETHFLKAQVTIESWLHHQWHDTPAPLTGSVDLRNAGFKVAPVDMNLFPAGFNNLNPAFMPLSIQAVQAVFKKQYPEGSRVLLLPESHTRNHFYFESLAVLRDIIVNAGFEVRIGSLRDDIKTKEQLTLPSGRSLCLEPVIREGGRIGVAGFFPCLLWLNNDLSEGVPEKLQGLSQIISPAIALGWHQRLKSSHFLQYQRVCDAFARVIGIDPWLINPLFGEYADFNVDDNLHRHALANLASTVLSNIQKKYDEYGIREKPYLIVKSDSGTYGLAVMTVREIDALLHLNRRQRSRMTFSKGGKPVDRLIIQEGVYSVETLGCERSVAEPVVYMIGHHVVGGFYRLHHRRQADESLNTPGMAFEPLAFVDDSNNSDGNIHNRFYMYGVIARLSALAAAREIKEVSL